MNKRLINNIKNLKFKAFDNYGKVINGMSWHKISYDKINGGFGSYFLKMEFDSKSLFHKHNGFKEFLIIKG
tara:strand:- start:1153 stop:1365 length:213 start_codon:yes stop_codon:yes gene_type:complete